MLVEVTAKLLHWQIEKATKTPIGLRLGSLDYCDKSEGK